MSGVRYKPEANFTTWLHRKNQTHLNDAVRDLLPAYAENDLSSLCSWADHVKFRYPWSSALHYINTPDDLCTYSYDRDCKDDSGEAGRCVSGAIKNYTSQLLTYGKSATQNQYNLTEALLFLSHFIGDIHQALPLMTGGGGGEQQLMCTSTVEKQCSTIITNEKKAMQVWDDNIIETTEEQFYNSHVAEFVAAINQNITGKWSYQVKEWGDCSDNKTTCPDKYVNY
ncbi:Endonuclease 2, partial [Ananas comosus]